MNFLIIYSRGKWVADVFLGNFPRWSLFNLRARFLLFGNEKSQKLNLNNLKSKRPLAVRENEAVWQKTRKTVCETAGVCVCAAARMWCVRRSSQHRLYVLLYVLLCNLHAHDPLSIIFMSHWVYVSAVWLHETCCMTWAVHMDARVCFVLDPLSSSVSLTLAKRQLPLQFSRSLILMAGPLWDWVGACGDRWMRPHTHIKHTRTPHIHTL